MLVVIGVIPIEYALDDQHSGYCFSYNVTDATGHVLRTTTTCTHPASAAGLPVPLLVIPAIAAALVYVRLSQRRSTAPGHVAPPRTHDRTEAQSVEIVLALLVGVSAGASVAVISRLLQHRVGATGGPGWSAATTALAVSAGLGALLDQLLHPSAKGL